LPWKPLSLESDARALAVDSIASETAERDKGGASAVLDDALLPFDSSMIAST
jgi:hypothetical protein